MNATDQRAKSLFLEAVEELPPDRWPAFLDEHCHADPQLRRDVEELLKAHAAPDSLLDGEVSPATLDMPPAVEPPGTQIGPYTLREQIGEGGFGVVYVAEQEKPVARKVALKIIKPGMDTREVIARFEAERQALALMDHPNIAKVLDAGTTGETPKAESGQRKAESDGPPLSAFRSPLSPPGRPFFVMELVRGVPITEFCDERKLNTRDRLALFIDVCRAVQHAHQKGIIHRDLKPSNVMVTLHDDKPVVKVIDFGVAKALSSKLTEKTVYTAYGQMLGTPLYMSPEQAQLSGLDVDTRSDVYSLGVLLYELLTGTTPFNKETLKTVGFDELRRIIREDDPPRPSARISTLDANLLSTVSDKRKVDARKLAASLRGELDWIVMRALEKDRNRRYESASAFAADVERFLADEPVQARPPSVWYRFRKFVRRNRAALVTSTLVVATLVGGLAASLSQAVRATRAERLANDRYQSEQRARREADSQRKRAEGNVQLALDALEQVYLPLAEAEFSEKVELTQRDREFLEKTLPFYEKLASQKASDEGTRYMKARAYSRVASIYRALGKRLEKSEERAEKAFRRAIASFQKLSAQNPAERKYRRDLAIAWFQLGQLLYARQEWRKAGEEAFRQAIETNERLVEDMSQLTDRHRLVDAQRGFADRLQQTRQWQEALRLFQENLARSRKLLDQHPRRAIHHAYVARALSGIGRAEAAAGRPKQAEQHFRKAVQQLRASADRFPNDSAHQFALAHALTALASFLKAKGGYNRNELERTYDEARRLLEKLVRRYPDRNPYRSTLGFKTLPALAILLEDHGRYPEAVAAWKRAVELTGQLAVEIRGAWEWRAVRQRADLSRALRKAGQRKEADRFRREAIAALDELHPTTASEYHQRAKLYRDLVGDDNKAFADFDKAIALQPSNAYWYYERGMLHLGVEPEHGSRDKRDLPALERRKEYRKALADFDKSLQLDPTSASYRYKRRALAHFYLKNYQAALADIGKSIDASPGDDHNLWFIRLSLVARCPDKGFREGMVKLADRVIEKNDAPIMRRIRGGLLAALGQYERALADFRQPMMFKRGRDDYSRYLMALAALGGSDHSTYRETCRNIIKRCHPYYGIWACALAPNALNDYTTAIQSAQRTVKNSGGFDWAQQNLGAILLRAGRYDEAIRTLMASLKAKRTQTAPLTTVVSPTYARYLLAIAHHRLRHKSEARRQLAMANRQADWVIKAGADWTRWQTLRILRREAEALIRPDEKSFRAPAVARKPKHN